MMNACTELLEVRSRRFSTLGDRRLSAIETRKFFMRLVCIDFFLIFAVHGSFRSTDLQ
jgi:hypothetical protein